MKSNFLKVNFKKVFIVVFLVSILSPLIFVLGCSGGGDGGKGDSSPPTPTPPNTSGNRKIFVANVFGNRISVFDAEDSGNVAPIRSIGSNTELLRPSGIFVDTENNEIFVINLVIDLGQDPIEVFSSITVYGRTDSGDVPPLRIISGQIQDFFVRLESL